MKKITLLISESNHPVYPFLERWKKEKENIYDISLVTTLFILIKYSHFIHSFTISKCKLVG